MFETLHIQMAHRHHRRFGATRVPAALLAAGCLALPLAVPGADEDPVARDLTVEQNVVFAAQAPAPAAAETEPLEVVAWVDHADNTYAVGERVRLFVRANKDSYLTVLNVGASGRTTVLFPNAYQTETRLPANQVVEIPSPNSGASITVSGPTGHELIKVVASTNPTPLFAAGAGQAVGPFKSLDAESQSVARDLQVTMDTQAEQEWDDYNKVIATIPSRPSAVMPLAPAPAGTAWPAQPFGLRIASGKPVYRMGEAVSLYASTTAPCYLTLVNIGSSGQTRVLLPNVAQPQNLIPAGQTLVFPVTGSNLQLTPMGPPGMETVVAVCSADNQPVFPAGFAYDRSGFATMDAGAARAARDLAVVSAAPVANRPVGQAAVGFVVTQ